MNIRRLGYLCAIIAAIFMSPVLSDTSGAAEIQSEFRIGGGYTDNINRSRDMALDETIGQAGFTFNLNVDEGRLDIELLSDLDYLHYVDDTFDDELIGGARALVDFSLVPERFNWLIVNNYGQQLVDPLEVPTPQNRENVNFLTTGPSIELRLGRRTSFGIEAFYSNLQYEIRPLDNERQEGRVWFAREIRRDTELSLNARTLITEFDDPNLNSDFDINEAFLRFERLPPHDRFSLAIDLGVSELEFGNERPENSLLLRAEIRRYVSTYTSLMLTGGSGYTDPGRAFRMNQNESFDDGGTQNIDGDGVPFRHDYANFAIQYDVDRTNVAFRVGWQQEDYNGRINRDRDIITTSLMANRDLSRRFFANFQLDYHRSDYSVLVREDSDYIAGVGLGLRLSRTFSVSVDYGYFSRSSSDSQFEYDESRIFLNLAYTPRWDEARFD